MVLEVLPKDTVVITADRHSRLLKGRHLDFVLSGFTVPGSQSGLTLPVAAGVAFISGYRVEHTATENLTMVDNTTNYVFLLKDGMWHIDQDNSQPADSVPICSATTSGGNITSTTDKRPLAIHNASQIEGLSKVFSDCVLAPSEEKVNTSGYQNIGLQQQVPFDQIGVEAATSFIKIKTENGSYAAGAQLKNITDGVVVGGPWSTNSTTYVLFSQDVTSSIPTSAKTISFQLHGFNSAVNGCAIAGKVSFLED